MVAYQRINIEDPALLSRHDTEGAKIYCSTMVVCPLHSSGQLCTKLLTPTTFKFWGCMSWARMKNPNRKLIASQRKRQPMMANCDHANTVPKHACWSTGESESCTKPTSQQRIQRALYPVCQQEAPRSQLSLQPGYLSWTGYEKKIYILSISLTWLRVVYPQLQHFGKER